MRPSRGDVRGTTIAAVIGVVAVTLSSCSSGGSDSSIPMRAKRASISPTAMWAGSSSVALSFRMLATQRINCPINTAASLK